MLAEKLAEGLPIRHGMTVEQIQWGPTGVTLHCQGGEKVEADAAIVTVSLGVLKVSVAMHITGVAAFALCSIPSTAIYTLCAWCGTCVPDSLSLSSHVHSLHDSVLAAHGKQSMWGTRAKA